MPPLFCEANRFAAVFDWNALVADTGAPNTFELGTSGFALNWPFTLALGCGANNGLDTGAGALSYNFKIDAMSSFLSSPAF